MRLNRVIRMGQIGHRSAGFTLIEILLVIVIILLLAGALVVFVLPQQKGAERNTTKLMLSQVASALDMYRLNLGHYPKEEEGGLEALLKKPTFENERLAEKWQGPYLKPGTKLEDPWGNKLMYELLDTAMGTGADSTASTTTGTGTGGSSIPYKLFSVGPDGQPDTEDDLKYLSEEDSSTDSGAGSSTSSP